MNNLILKSFFIAFVMLLFLSSGQAQELKMWNGFLSNKYYADEQRVPLRTFEETIKKDETAYKMWAAADKRERASTIAVGMSIGISLFGYYAVEKKTLPLIAAGGLLIGGGIGMSNSREWKQEAISVFNDLAGRRDLGINLRLGITSNGIGLLCLLD